jgi:hypothetical protein
MTVLPIAILASGCARPSIHHVVLIELNDESGRESLVADCDRLLPSIPSVATYWCGEHGDFGRTGVDSDYDVALCVSFDSDADYQTYLSHPHHVELVTEWKPRMAWIRIHDVVDETP